MPNNSLLYFSGNSSLTPKGVLTVEVDIRKTDTLTITIERTVYSGIADIGCRCDYNTQSGTAWAVNEWPNAAPPKDYGYVDGVGAYFFKKGSVFFANGETKKQISIILNKGSNITNNTTFVFNCRAVGADFKDASKFNGVASLWVVLKSKDAYIPPPPPVPPTPSLPPPAPQPVYNTANRTFNIDPNQVFYDIDGYWENGKFVVTMLHVTWGNVYNVLNHPVPVGNTSAPTVIPTTPTKAYPSITTMSDTINKIQLIKDKPIQFFNGWQAYLPNSSMTQFINNGWTCFVNGWLDITEAVFALIYSGIPPYLNIWDTYQPDFLIGQALIDIGTLDPDSLVRQLTGIRFTTSPNPRTGLNFYDLERSGYKTNVSISLREIFVVPFNSNPLNWDYLMGSGTATLLVLAAERNDWWYNEFTVSKIEIYIP
jgi:hypothetical protein